MAAGPQFTIPPNHLPLPEGVQGVKEWVYHLPLRTAEVSVIMLSFKESHTGLQSASDEANQPKL